MSETSSNPIISGRWKIGSFGYSSRQVFDVFRASLFVFIGDSNTRSIYKDFVSLLNSDDLTAESDLRLKGELSFKNDKLIQGGVLGKLSNGTHYKEEREYITPHHHVKFYFVTRAYYEYTEKILDDLKRLRPDFVYINSCCWDITRWSDEIKDGPYAFTQYTKNLIKLFTGLKYILPQRSRILWGCCMPLAETMKGGFAENIRTDNLFERIIKANYTSSIIAKSCTIDVIDFNYYFRNYQEARKADGIHWNNSAQRNITYMLVAHISDAQDLKVMPSVKYAQPIISERLDQRDQNTNYTNKMVDRNIRKARHHPYSKKRHNKENDSNLYNIQSLYGCKPLIF